LIEALFESGLLQVGVYDGVVACRAMLEMLPSYPDVLRQVVAVLQERWVGNVNRIVCGTEAIGLGAGMALASGVPCIWFGSRDKPVFEGAYDIIHPSVWVMLRDDDYSPEQRQHITHHAERVGLQIVQTVAVMGKTNGTAILTWDGAVAQGMRVGLVPTALGRAILG
jgi:hypothetical protein